MHPVRKQKLILVLAIVVGSSAVVALIGYAMRDYADYFYPVSKVVAGEAPLHRSIRAGGCVVPGSIQHGSEGLITTFEITDGIENLTVSYDGILPDMFGEGEAAVVNGKMGEDGVMVATKVLAKHDENYTPKEVAESVQNAENMSDACKGLQYGS